MSFAQEMKDFYTGFRATYAVSADIKDRKLRQQALDVKAAGTWAPDDSNYHPYSPGDLTSGDGVDGADDAVVEPASDEGTDSLDDNGETIWLTNGMAGHMARGGAIPSYAYGGLVTGSQKGRQPLDMRKLKPQLVSATKRTMKSFGKDVPVVSAYRDKKRNKKAGGAKHSQHLDGNAFDFDVSGLSRTERIRFIKTMSANGFSGIGVYNNSIHGDLGPRRSWGPDHSHKSVPKWASGAISEHLSGKLKGYNPGKDANLYADAEEAPSESPSQSDDGYDYAADYASADDGSDIADAFDRGSQAIADGYDDGSQAQDYTAGSRAAMNPTEAIEVPQGAGLYRPGDLTQTPMYAAEGGSVPWKDEVSHLHRQNFGAIPTYRPAQSYGPLADLPDVAVDPKVKNPKNKNKNRFVQPRVSPQVSTLRGGHDGMSPAPNLPGYNGYGPQVSTLRGGHDGMGTPRNLPGYNGFGQQISTLRGGRDGITFNPNAVRPTGMPGYRKSFAEGGTVPEEDDVTSEVTAIPASAPPPAARALPPAPAGNPRGSNREALAMEQTHGAGANRSGGSSSHTVIDAGLKYLTRSLGLDKAASAVGPDPELRSAKTKLINGAIGPNEGPPTQQEVEDGYKVVDPNGELNSGLRTIYLMKQGYDFYMTHGQPDKAGKFVAGMIQYSNLLSKRFGYEAVKAGQAGDEEGMVSYAIKAYDAVPDALNANVKKAPGGYEVTRTDEDGKVVDRHMLTPQQVFQMATGISQGSGFFEAMMESGKKAMTPYQKAQLDLSERRLKLQEEKDGKLTPAQQRQVDADKNGTNYYVKLFPGIKASMSPDEQSAWDDAVKAGDPRLLKDMYENKVKDQDKKTQQKLKDREITAQKTMFPDYESEMTVNQKKAVQQALADGDTDTVQRVYSQIDNKRSTQAAADRSEEKRTSADNAKLEAKKRKARILDKRYPLYKDKLQPADQEAWKDAVEAGEPDIISAIIRSVDYEAGAPITDDTATDGDNGEDPPPPPAPAPAPAPAAQTALPEAPAPVAPQAPAVTPQSNKTGVLRTKIVDGITYELSADGWRPAKRS